MYVYLRIKVSCIILMSFSQGGNFTKPRLHPLSTANRTTKKKPTQIRVNQTVRQSIKG